MDHEADAYRTDLMTITRYVLNEQSRNPEARGDLTILLSHIVLGCKFVASAVNKAGLAKLIGLAGETNVQASVPGNNCHLSQFLVSEIEIGEEQKKLDVLSNEVFVKALVSSGRTCVLVSEEDEEATFVDPALRGKYCVCFDPLDGSSNIDCGVSIGTIFGIYMIKDKENVTLEDVLQPGKNMVAAGYCMYGSSCTLVLSTGNGVNGFTLDPSLGEFILTHPDIKIPKKGKIYSVNEGNAKNWDEPTAKFVEKCKFPKDGSSPKSLRYIGSMVADVHRTLLYGGVFLYPADKKSPNGKLRYTLSLLSASHFAYGTSNFILINNSEFTKSWNYSVLYEVFPMSFLMEQAGGQSFTGKERALDLVPTKIHERSPIFLGSFEDVEEIKGLYAAQAK
uniref:fructose-bisphosphatase n=2 Tax=Oryza TaxID=4527 RepID=A0A0E0FW52_ORYNI